MLRKSLPVLALLFLPAFAWAGPASRPTLESATRVSEPASRPAINLAELQREYDATLRQVSRARFDAADHFDATRAGQAAKAEVAAKDRMLEAARAVGSAEDRLEASSAYNKARAARDLARDASSATDPELLHALAAADRAKADLDRGKAALGIKDVVVAAPPAPAPPPAARPEYRVESGKTIMGMRSISITFTVVSDAQQVESVLRSELMSAVEKEPPAADILIYAQDDDGKRLTTPDGSPGMIFIEAERQVVTLKEWAGRKRR